MTTRRAASRRRSGRMDSGAAWISYSDMMAALLLVFVLVLCYSVFQYFAMLESKTAELEEKGQLLNTQEQQLALQKDQLDEQQSQLQSKQNDLNSALSALQQQQTLLDTQSTTLSEQEATISAAQTALKDKENALAATQSELADQQVRLFAATELLRTQQTAMDTQQQKLDELVGVRTQIIRELGEALTSASLKASVDKNTGDIVLESSVFFDVGKYDIKETGQKLLNQFIPLYLSVLLRDEYASYLGEIIIEGHTDTQGTYLNNLELSQDRALSVATYCLQMDGLTQKQRDQLRELLTAKGRSYSDPIYNSDGSIDMDNSRRVEFKFRLKDSEMIDELRTVLNTGLQ